jgi:ADP-ribosylation factor GTPase-activating protein 2/3
VPSSTAVRKTATAAKPKSNILGAKKTKLGAKKVDSAALDFDEAEKKAREEAERKERLGYDPDEVSTMPAENTIVAAQPDSSATTIHQPTPLSPGRAGGFGSTGQSRQRSDSEMERLGMATRKLGFGQVGVAAQKTSTAGGATRGLGFGAVSKPVVQGKIDFCTGDT